jgi:protein-S-isoprenylcysteine O-methyltransferase Ste14
MNLVVWVGQVLLALAFLGAGFTHSIGYNMASKNRGMVWMRALPAPMVKTIGILEILGAVGVILPALTGILTWLTPLAALLLGVVMVLAIGLHISRREAPNAMFNAVLGLLAFAVAFGRIVVSPF